MGHTSSGTSSWRVLLGLESVALPLLSGDDDLISRAPRRRNACRCEVVVALNFPANIFVISLSIKESCQQRGLVSGTRSTLFMTKRMCLQSLPVASPPPHVQRWLLPMNTLNGFCAGLSVLMTNTVGPDFDTRNKDVDRISSISLAKFSGALCKYGDERDMLLLLLLGEGGAG